MRIFDSHFHIIDHRFPLVPNRGYLPDEFTCADYREKAKDIGIVGGAIVSGSFQAFDQSYLLAALETLGPAFVGVTQLPASTSDRELLDLDEAGVRGVRFNLRRGGSADVRDLDMFARRVHEVVNWHIEIYADAAALENLSETLIQLPAVVIDHLGLSRAAYPTLIKLVEHGTWVKAAGFGRLDFDPVPVIQDLLEVNPSAVVFGSDMPSTRAPRPFEEEDIQTICGALDNRQAERVLYENAIALYEPEHVVSE